LNQLSSEMYYWLIATAAFVNSIYV
jgi:hypothetical protein